MNSDGLGLERVTDYPDWDTYSSLSPDGTRIAWRRVTNNGERNSEVFVMNRDGIDPINLSRHPAFDGWPAWSPDGRKILFASNRDGIDRNDFNNYVIDVDGSNLQRLTHSPGYEDARPIWSLDGSKIVFNRQIGGTGAMEVFVLELSAQ